MPTKAAEYLDEKTLDGLNEDEPSNRALADGIKLILRKLWSEEDMRMFVEQQHKEYCEACLAHQFFVEQHKGDAPQEPITRRHVVMAVIKAPWFWLVVSTVCAVVCAKYGLSLPVFGGGSN